MIDIALSLCMCHQIYDYVCIFVGWVGGWGGGLAYGLHYAPPLLWLSLNMCTLSTNINVMHDLKVIPTLLATVGKLMNIFLLLLQIIKDQTIFCHQTSCENKIKPFLFYTDSL